MWEENPWEIFQGKPTQMGLKPISHSVPSGIRTEVEGEERPPAKDIRRVKLSQVSDFTWGVTRKVLFYQIFTKFYTTVILYPNSFTKQNWTHFEIKFEMYSKRGWKARKDASQRYPSSKVSNVSDFTWGVKRKLLFYQMLTKVYTTLILNPNSLTKQNWTPFAIKLKGIKNEVGRRGKTPAQVIRRAKLAMYQILHEGQNENFCFTKYLQNSTQH